MNYLEKKWNGNYRILFWTNPWSSTQQNSRRGAISHLTKYQSKMYKTYWALMMKKGQTHKGSFPTDYYTWTHQCCLLNKDLHSLIMCRHRILSRRLAKSNGQLGQMTKDTQGNLCWQHTLIMMMMYIHTHIHIYIHIYIYIYIYIYILSS